MKFIASVYERLRRSPKRVVFPEGTEPRVLRAASRYVKLGLGTPILLGDKDAIEKTAADHDVALEHMGIIDPRHAEDLDLFCERLEKLKRYRDLGPEMAHSIMSKPNFFGAMMVQYGQADAIVTGADEEASSTLRPLLQLISPLPHLKSVSSCMALDLSNKRYGERGVMFFADCAVIPDPTVDQLADIAVETGVTCRTLTGLKPRIAMLSFTTHSSGRLPGPAKVAAATALARQRVAQRGLEMEIDGELQADTAILPELGAKKAPQSLVAGRANVLIFPDLASSNIAVKLVQYLAGAETYGQLLIGLARPCADLSRGATEDDILGVAAIVGLQAVEGRKHA
ncbi:MAG: phosphate acyltransferase [Verrucomicrobiota bacterium]